MGGVAGEEGDMVGVMMHRGMGLGMGMGIGVGAGMGVVGVGGRVGEEEGLLQDSDDALFSLTESFAGFGDPLAPDTLFGK